MVRSLVHTYRAKRNFAVTPEPQGVGASGGSLFVVQKHTARRAGLHWDFRLEHDGVLWSWAVPKGPSMDPADRRMAIHVEDHPVDYAGFQGTIPQGEYGGGAVEIWDRGAWEPIGDPAAGLHDGNLKFVLDGQRLHGRFELIRMRTRDPRKPEAWLLIKGRDDAARVGAGAAVLERDAGPPAASARAAPVEPPAEGAVRGVLPADQAPQLCRLVETAPEGDGWISEIKFDGYRVLAWVTDGRARLVTRGGHDWTGRLPALADAIGRMKVASALLDGELVALREDGASSFADLQAALTDGQDRRLVFYAFDLLALDGWDLRRCRLLDRKQLLRGLAEWNGMLRFSDHAVGRAGAMSGAACRRHLEGIVCKRADSPYRGGRGRDWVKVKCVGREEFVLLGWTPPAGRRTGLGALQVGYFDHDGRLHYAGGVGTGFSDSELTRLRRQLDPLAAEAPKALLASGDPPDPAIRWVRPELVVEVQYAAWSGAGRLRHAVYLGLREDKAAGDVVRDIADPEAARREPSKGQPMSSRVVTARAPKKAVTVIGDVELTHPDRELWPGLTKRDLAEYWTKVAAHALPGLARRPLSIVRCPDGIDGERFFQKNGHGHLPHRIREGSVAGQPFLAIDDADGLVALAQMAAIELHPWGAPEADPLRPDWLVFDLDPGEGAAFSLVVEAAHEVRDRLQRLGLASFCRTTGGKGLHVVAPLTPDGGWDRAKSFCHAFAETLAGDRPDRYLAHLKIADRGGRVLIDWLRNGLGATAASSFCPRARPGAGVATPLDWKEVTAGLDPAEHTLKTVPARLARQRRDPWAAFWTTRQTLPDLAPQRAAAKPAGPRARSAIVTAHKPARTS